MNLNLTIIANYLKIEPFQTSLTEDPLICPLHGLQIYENGIVISENRLLIAYAKDLEEISQDKINYSILCIGVPSPSYLNKGHNILYIEKDISIITVSNEIENIFQYFNQWEYKLQRISYSTKDIQELCDASLVIFNNPISVYTSGHQLICYSEIDKQENLKLFHKSDINNFLDMEEISIMKADREFVESITCMEPTIFSDKVFGYRILFNNLKIDQKYIARICVCEIENSIRQSDFVLLNVLSYYAEYCILGLNDVRYNNHPKGFDQMIIKLLNNQSQELPIIKNLLQQNNWSLHDSYFCCVMPISIYDKTIHTVTTITLQLSKIISGSCLLQYNDSIILIINITQSKKSRNQHLADLAYIIRECLLKAGVSLEFNDFEKLHNYYQQAGIALNYGNIYDETNWCHRFEEYSLRFLLQNGLQNYYPEVFYPQGLLLLKEYDQRKRRNYCQILQTYLENNMNIAKTIRKLFIQRATFIYQLKRIIEISNLDLSNYHTRLMLMISFQLKQEIIQDEKL